MLLRICQLDLVCEWRKEAASTTTININRSIKTTVGQGGGEVTGEVIARLNVVGTPFQI